VLTEEGQGVPAAALPLLPTRELVLFREPFDTRNPDGRTVTRRDPGNYTVGPPGVDGYRPVYDADGRVIGYVPADKVPPPVISRQP